MSEKRRVASVAEILGIGVDIEGIRFFGLSASVNDSFDEADLDEEVVPSYGMKSRHDGRELGYRMTARLEPAIGSVFVDIAVDYVLAEDVDISDELRLEFANEVAVMTLLPYVRSAIGELTLKVFGTPLLMPIMQRGEVTFTAP